MPLSITFHRPRRRPSSTDSARRKERRRRSMCLPCVAIERNQSSSDDDNDVKRDDSAASSRLRRPGFEHVDAARCGCSARQSSPPTSPSASPERNSVSRTRERSVGRRRQDDILRRSGLGGRGRSLQWHDLNNNMMVLVTLGEGNSASGSTTGTASGSSSSSALSNSAASSEEGGNDMGSDTDSSARESAVTEESSLSNKLQEGDPREIVVYVMKELEGYFDVEPEDRLMDALEANLDKAEGIHPDERTKGHWMLAKWHGEEKAEAVLRHCRNGLFMLHMREKLFPEWAAEMNMMAAKALLKVREGDFVKEVIRLVESARAAMFAFKERDADLEFKLYVIEAEAWAVWEEECEGLVKASSAYEKAADMLKMGALNVGSQWVGLALLHLQVMLRGLRHKKRCSCRGGEEAEVGKVIEKAEALRKRIVRFHEGASQVVEVSTAHELVARAYLQRGGASDLRKAKVALEKALNECSWRSGNGGRYALLRDMGEDVGDRIDQLSEEEVQPEESESVPSEEEGDLFW